MKDALLLITDRTSPSNRYAPYLGELLHAEGLCGFRTEELSEVNEALLAQAGVLVLTRCSVTEKQRDLLANYVAAGGQLILVAPEAIWEPLIGLIPLPTGVLDGYLKLEVTQELSRGLPAESFQFHGAARHWASAGAQTLAALYSDTYSATGFPAVSLHHVGKGRVAAFSFDVAESVATTRQGNPRCAFAKLDDTNNAPRPGDLFGGGWIDVSKEHIPQADVQQALLGRLIEMLSPVPLPRIWYLPGLATAVLLLTGDGEAADPADFHAQVEGVERYGAHITFYLKENTQITPEHEATWRARGHSFGLHPWAGPWPTLQLICEEFPRQEALFRSRFGHGSRTVRPHGLQWCGYTEQARLLARMGISMDLTYVSSRPSLGRFLTGSGRAMRFVSERGEILPVWQQATQLEDDLLLGVDYRQCPSSAKVPNVHTYNLTTDEAVLLSEQALTASAHHYHTPIVMNVHPPFYTRFSGPWMGQTLAFAQRNHIPVCSAEEWLDFVEARDKARVQGLTYEQGRLLFALSSVSPQAGLSLTLPYEHRGRIVQSVTRGGRPTEFTRRQIQGLEKAFVSLDGGTDHDFVVTYG